MTASVPSRATPTGSTLSPSAKFLIVGLVLALFVTAIWPTWPIDLALVVGGGIFGLVGGVFGLVVGAIATVFALLVAVVVLVCVAPIVLIALLIAGLAVAAAALLVVLVVALPVLLPIVALVWFIVWAARRPSPPRPASLPAPRAA